MKAHAHTRVARCLNHPWTLNIILQIMDFMSIVLQLPIGSHVTEPQSKQSMHSANIQVLQPKQYIHVSVSWLRLSTIQSILLLLSQMNLCKVYAQIVQSVCTLSQFVQFVIRSYSCKPLLTLPQIHLHNCSAVYVCNIGCQALNCRSLIKCAKCNM